MQIRRSAVLASALIMAGSSAALAVPNAKNVGVSPRGTGETLPDKTIQRLAPPLSFDRLGYAEGLPNSNVHAIVQDRDGFVWFGTQDGLARYDGIKIRVYRRVETDPTSISASYITALALDPSGKIWVGTAENGVNLYDPMTDRFTRFGRGKGALSSAGVTAILRDAKNRMWFAMTGGGLNRFDPQTNSFVEFVTGSLETNVTSMAADAAGNLWLGTSNQGVLRWNPDDKSIIAIAPKADDPDAIGTAAITAIHASSGKTVWFGSDGDGLYTYDTGTKRLVRLRHVPADLTTISDDHITVLFEDRKSAVWVGTANGLNKILDAKGTVEQYHHDPNDPTSLAFPGVDSLFQDAGGVMWVGGFTAGVCKFDEHRIRFGRHRTRTHPANSYFEDDDGSVWVGTYHGGLYHYDWAAKRVTLRRTLGASGAVGSIALESTWISALHRDRNKTLWIALLGQGLVAFDTRTETYKRYVANPDNPKSLPVDTVWDIWEDPQGVLWLATWGSGLVKLDPKTEIFTPVPTEDISHIYTLYPDPLARNILWIGAAKGGLLKFDLNTGTATSFRHRPDDATSLSSDDVLSIHRDRGGALWVGTYGGGLNRLDPATGRGQSFRTANSGLPNDVIWGVLPDDDGNLWLSTNGGGLVELDTKSNKFLVYTSSDGIQGDEFAQGSFMRSKTGRLYFGGVNGFNAFFPKEITRDAYVPPVVITSLKVFNHEVTLDRPIWTLPSLELSYADSFELQFAALSFAAPAKNRYAYKLEGFDDKFIETDRPYATYTKLDGGKYKLRVRAANRHGVWNETGVELDVRVTPPVWRTWPAYIVYLLLLAGAAVLLVYLQRQRVRRVVRDGRLAIIERDLALTGAVQSGFLPGYNTIHDGKVNLYGFYRAADACSGDWWWHEVIGHRHIILVGDVTGHGPGPAMVTAAVATAFRVLTVSGLDDVTRGLEILNQVVLQVAKGKYHMTMAAFELDETTGSWVLHNAGAPPIMSLPKTGKHRVHFCAGTPLGIDTMFEPGRTEGKLEPSDRILICTDGIPEIVLPNGSALGMRRLAQTYEMTRGRPLQDAAAAIIQQADLSQGGKPQDDDWTFAIIEWTGART